MIGEHDDLLNVQFSYAEPQHSQLYRDFFDCPIHFNTSKSSIFFNAEILKRPLKSYSPANYTTAIRICEKRWMTLIILTMLITNNASNI